MLIFSNLAKDAEMAARGEDFTDKKQLHMTKDEQGQVYIRWVDIMHFLDQPDAANIARAIANAQKEERIHAA